MPPCCASSAARSTGASREVLEEDASGEAPEPQVIAWHFAEGGMPDKSLEYYRKAAEHATGRFALAEMVHHLRNALRQMAHVPDFSRAAAS